MNQDLIPAVLTYIQEKEGFATKTKLLKLLYLLDLESYRDAHQTLTGFSWMFYLYGPWAPEYDTALQDLEAHHKIALRSGNRTDLDTVFINSLENTSLDAAFPNISNQLKAKRIIEAWADRPTGEILDYVYFHTSPMRDAQRNMPLDFSTLDGELSPLDIPRRQSKVDPRIFAAQKRLVLEAIKKAKVEVISPLDPPPRYDEDFFQALEALEKD
jgi:hypothetical protein